MQIPDVRAAIEDFVLAMQAEDKSAGTVEWYKWHLTKALGKMQAVPVDQVEVTAIRRYLADVRSQPTHQRFGQEVEGSISTDTLRGRITALKRFFNWCQLEYDLSPASNPMLKIRKPSRPHQEPKAITLDDLRKLFQSCTDDVRGKRNRAILAFLADTGCRAGGLLSLRLENLYINQGRAIVREKGDRTRVVPFTRYTAKLLQDWLEVRPQDAPTVFCTLGSTPERFATRLTINGLTMILRRLKEKSGIAGRCNPHSFRHGFAREYLTNGGDLATLARLMGHSNSSITSSYYSVFDERELASRHEIFSPLKDFGGSIDGE